MSDFKANMHQIRSLLGLCLRPCWETQRFSRPQLYLKGLLLWERRGGKSKGIGVEGRKEWDGREERTADGGRREGAHENEASPPLCVCNVGTVTVMQLVGKS